MAGLNTLARRLLAYEGVPAAQAATALRVSVNTLRAERRRLGRDPEVGGPPRRDRQVDELVDEGREFDAIDRLMRTNRSAGL